MQYRINLRSICSFVVSTCLLLWTLSARAAPVSQYTITDLGATAIPLAITTITNMVVGVQDVGTTPNQHQVAHILAPNVQHLPMLPQGTFSTAQGVYGATAVGGLDGQPGSLVARYSLDSSPRPGGSGHDGQRKPLQRRKGASTAWARLWAMPITPTRRP